MIAANLISDIVSPISTSDTGEQVLTMMNIYHVKHLPVVNNEQLLAVISEEDVINNLLEEPVGSYELSKIKPYVSYRDHLFEVLKNLADNHLTTIAVIDDDGNYMGIITQEDLVRYYAGSFSFTESGSIVVLETTKHNYSLSALSRIVEEENAAVLTSFLSSVEDSTKITITLKINKQDVTRILQSFERYDYEVKATFAEEDYIDGLKDRYDLLMNYLNV